MNPISSIGSMSGCDLNCTLEEARRICQTISRHIGDLTDASARILLSSQKDRTKDSLRSAYVLTLLALDETGKMFKIWQIAADAEKQGEPEKILVKDLFRDHELKGGLATDLCCQMFDCAVGWLDQMMNAEAPGTHNYEAIKSVKVEFSKAIVHLKMVYQSFKSEREVAMYVSADNEREWTRRRPTISEAVTTENLLLWLVANVANSYLNTKGRFDLAIIALLDIRNGIPSDQAYAFYGRLMVGALTP